MDGQTLKYRIGQKRPRYKEQYRSLIENISVKGDSSGKGDFSAFGAFYQTYMYAFIIGYKLGIPKFIEKGEKTIDFASFVDWKPTSVSDFILTLLLNYTDKYSIAFSWVELENANEETIDNFIAELFRQMEGYANTGFEYLQNKWDNEKIEFQDSFVFVNFLGEFNN